MQLFDDQSEGAAGGQGGGRKEDRRVPLAVRMRPRSLDEIVGQEHILGPGRLLRRAIEADRLDSVILYGPPGSGKTTIAEVIARETRRRFERTSGVLSNVAELRRLLESALYRKQSRGEETILFIDEIHRFNKAQQDVLLPYVENGDVILIGATTHNPYFFVNSPLVSRSRIFQLEPLSEAAVLELLRRALTSERGLGPLRVTADEEALRHLARVCDGDARVALNALEIAALTTPPDANGRIHITLEVAEDSIQKKAVVYDHDEDGHYDTISAFIKSVRGSDPDAALLAGEDAVCGRGSPLHRPAADHPGFGRHRQCRAAGAAAGGGGPAGGGFRGHAGGTHHSGAGDELSGHGPQEQCSVRGGGSRLAGR